MGESAEGGAEVKVKPLLRGVSHQAAFFVAAGAGAMLLAVAPTPHARQAAGIYVLTLLALFGVSAVYHRVHWEPAARAQMKRLDHATIFLFIAGSYTPVCLLALPAPLGPTLLGWAWLGALVGIGRAILWPRAPKAVSAALYCLLGWLVVAFLPAVAAGVGTPGMWALGAGGVLYSLGAVAYASKRPALVPAVFGYHEVFHACVIAAVVCHFTVIAHLVLTSVPSGPGPLPVSAARTAADAVPVRDAH